MIAKPFSPGNAFPPGWSRASCITFDKALIGSCTKAATTISPQAALVLKAAATGHEKVEREFAIFPGSGGVEAADRAGRSPPCGESSPTLQVGRRADSAILGGPCFGRV